MSTAERILAPITMGARDIRGLTPQMSANTFSEQVAQAVADQDEIERGKQERKQSFLPHAALALGGGAALGGMLGAVKGGLVTHDLWNPKLMMGAAAVGGAGSLAIALLRRAAAKKLTAKAKEQLEGMPAAVRYVASHPGTQEKARDWESARWAPFVGAEVGALAGGIGGLAYAASTAKPGEGVSAIPGVVGAGALGLAGLGLGYLYRKHKQNQFLEHVENELSMSQSPKAQEATLQAEIEREPMEKSAESDADRRKRLFGYAALGIGGVSAIGAAALLGPRSYAALETFSEKAKSWSDVKTDPREMSKDYAILGSDAVAKPTLPVVGIVEAYRKSPLASKPWTPRSGEHYREFDKGPAFAYMQLANEAADPTDKSESAQALRAGISGATSAFHEYRKGNGLQLPAWIVHPSIDDEGARGGKPESLAYLKERGLKPEDIPAGSTQRLRDSFDKVFAEAKAVFGNVESNGKPRSRTDTRPSNTPLKYMTAEDAPSRLSKALADTSAKMFGQGDLSKLTHEQQAAVVRGVDQHLRENNSSEWAAKQIYDAGVGAMRYAAKDYYPGYIDPLTKARNVALYGGLAVAALGGGVLLHQWLTRKKEKGDNVVQFPQEQLEKAAMALVKEALVTGSNWPVVSTNAPLLNGNGGTPERYVSGKHGARRIYDYGLGAVESWKSSTKPQLEKHVKTEKVAEDDPNAHGEELDDVALGMARVLEEQYGSRAETEPPPSTKSVSQSPPAEAAGSEAPPSTKVAEDRSSLPYRKRVEVYAMKDGKVYGGVYKDGGFGVFGGGIDEDDLSTAAAREFLEETGLVANNVRLVPVEPVKIDWNPPYKSEKQAERAKQFRGAQTFFVVADLDDSKPVEKASGDDGKSPLRWPRLYDITEAIELCEKATPSEEGVKRINSARVDVLNKLRQQKVADAAQFLPRKEVLVFTPSGKLAIRRGAGRRFDLPSDIEGKPVPYEQPVHLLPEGGVPEKGVHGYQVALHSAEAALPEGFEEVDPQDALKDLYAALGKPENRPYQSLDRARARALLRLVKKRVPATAVA